MILNIHTHMHTHAYALPYTHMHTHTCIHPHIHYFSSTTNNQLITDDNYSLGQVIECVYDEATPTQPPPTDPANEGKPKMHTSQMKTDFTLTPTSYSFKQLKYLLPILLTQTMMELETMLSLIITS